MYRKSTTINESIIIMTMRERQFQKHLIRLIDEDDKGVNFETLSFEEIGVKNKAGFIVIDAVSGRKLLHVTVEEKEDSRIYL